MGSFCLALFMILVVVTVSNASTKPGVQLRLTNKGLEYGIKVAMGIMEKDLKGMTLKPQSGRSGHVKFNIKRAVVKEINLNQYSLSTLRNVGLRATVNGIKINIEADMSYEYKRWIFKFRDSFTVNARTSDAGFAVDLNIGRRNDGRPRMSVVSCSANVGNLKLQFSKSGASWLYNALSGVFKSRIRRQINDLLCEHTRKEVRERGDVELKTFPVRRVIDQYAFIDYSLIEKPHFSRDYMDVFLKGSFSPTKGSQKIPFDVPAFTTSSDASKMIYLWLTDYTLNTAGVVYHKTGRLQHTISLKERVLPSLLKTMLNTRMYETLVPGLYKKYPNRPMEIVIKSSQPPRVEMNPGKMTLLVFADFSFNVMVGSQRITAFTVGLDIKVSVGAKVQNDFIVGELKDFDFKWKLKHSQVGPVTVPSTAGSFVGEAIRSGIIEQIKPMFRKGIPMPSIDQVSFVNGEIRFIKHALLIATDCLFSA